MLSHTPSLSPPPATRKRPTASRSRDGIAASSFRIALRTAGTSLRVPIPVSQELLVPWLRLTATLRALEATSSAFPLTRPPIRSSPPALSGARSPFLRASPLTHAVLPGDSGLAYASLVSLRPSPGARHGGCARVSLPAPALSPVVIPPAALQVAMRRPGTLRAHPQPRGASASGCRPEPAWRCPRPKERCPRARRIATGTTRITARATALAIHTTRLEIRTARLWRHPMAMAGKTPAVPGKEAGREEEERP